MCMRKIAFISHKSREGVKESRLLYVNTGMSGDQGLSAIDEDATLWVGKEFSIIGMSVDGDRYIRWSGVGVVAFKIEEPGHTLLRRVSKA